MSTDKTLSIKSTSSNETEKVGLNLGQRLRGGESIELLSDIGGGKTTFVRGLATGAGSSDAVSSPTFTIAKQYVTPHFTIYHFDFYRLSNPGIINYELSDVVQDQHNVIVVEWGQSVQNVLPSARIKVFIEAVDDSTRQLTFKYPPSFDYVFAGLQPGAPA